MTEAVPLRTRDRSGRLILGAVLVSVAYSVLSTASRGICPGGLTGDGSFLDANGQTTDAAPVCLNLTLRPNWLIYLVVFAIVLIGIVVADRAAPERATRVLGVALAAAVVVPLAAAAVGYLWLFGFPLEAWRPGDVIWVPPLIDGQVATSVMGF